MSTDSIKVEVIIFKKTEDEIKIEDSISDPNTDPVEPSESVRISV